jgi:ATP-binding cassette, subfamily F, member 3
MERFVERFRYKATKARQAQERVKRIEKLKREGVAAQRRDRRDLRFSFVTPERPGRVVLKMIDAKIEVPGRTLLEDANLEVERGEHLVLVGPNGAGKTTLIEALAGRRAVAAGSVRIGHNVKIGYLSQHAETAAGEGTVLEAAQRQTGLRGQKARDLLGAFLFSGAEVEKALDDISGGEQRRLSLAILVASGANVLILDEPTNHLDIESREALEDALSTFEGAVILVSHDRALLEAVGTRTLVCEGGELSSHPTGWAAYQRERDEREAKAAAALAEAKRATARGRPPSPRRLSQRAARKASRLAEKIEDVEADLRALEDELSDPAAWSTPEKAERASERHETAKRTLAELYGQWEEAERAVSAADDPG